MLLFKKKFLDAIRQRTKTQTIRLWKYRRLKTGQRSYIPGAGYIRVDSVETVELDALTDKDAIPDGFPTADELREEIRKLYPAEVLSQRSPYRVVFSLLPEDEQRQLVAKREQAKAAKALANQPQPETKQPSFSFGKGQSSSVTQPATPDDDASSEAL